MEKIRIDYLHNHEDYKVAQHENMYHFNTDTCLLGEFIKINKGDNVLDVGTNNGALLVYIHHKGGICNGIEIQSEALDVCKITLDINNIEATLYNDDFTTWDQSKKFDVIVSNPPYFDSKDDLHRSKNIHKKLARHEGSLNLSSLAKSIKNHLKEDGRVYLVYRPNRLEELEEKFNENGLYINCYQFVYDLRKESAKSVLIELSFNKTNKKQLENKYI